MNVIAISQKAGSQNEANVRSTSSFYAIFARSA